VTLRADTHPGRHRSEPPPSIERCDEMRYCVRCTLPKDHDGLHRHHAPDDGIVLCWAT